MDKKTLNSIRVMGVEMVSQASSGHPGVVLGAAPTIYSLYSQILKVNPKDDKWINRDRFVLSGGHASALYYSTLYHAGFDVKIKDLINFRQMGSAAAGHPEINHIPGIDASTGPLGQGMAMATGMAMSEKFLNKKYPKIIDHYTYVMLGDGDLQDGAGKQSLEFAAHNKLGKLIFLFDSNDIQLDTPTNKATSVNRKEYIESLNMEYFLVENGENLKKIVATIKEAKKSEKASFIEIKTIIGIGSKNQGTSAVHGMPLDSGDLAQVRKKFDTYHKFEVPKKIKASLENDINLRMEKDIGDWEKKIEDFETNNNKSFKKMMSVFERTFEVKDYSKDLPLNTSTRITSGKLMELLQDDIPNMIGGSADLSGSTKIKGKFGDFPKGNNINFGVRDFSISPFVNGMQLHGGVVPFASTFYVFSDYSKPGIRLSALMEIPTLFVFSHDSIFVGEDGATHQPIEHNSMFRAMPNVNLFRPADEKEVAGAYMSALNSQVTPTIITVTRQDIVSLKESSVEKTQKGGYIIKKETTNKKLDAIVIATGSEVALCLKAVKELKSLNIRVVSMPCTSLFDKQKEEYKNGIIDKEVFTLAVEAASTLGWHKYIGIKGAVLGIDKFGLSAPGIEIYEKYGFTVTNIKDIIWGGVK